jgi:hypothetical protein
MILQLQRTVGNAAVNALLRQYRQAREGGQALHDVPQRPRSTASGPGEGRAILVQRKGGKKGITSAIKDTVVGAVGTDKQIAKMVGKRGPDSTDTSLEELFKPETEADLTPEQKAVRANKAVFLEEDIELAAQEQRKIKHVHEGVRERKAELGHEAREVKEGSLERSAIKAKLKVLEDSDLAKLTPEAQETKLKKAALKGEKKHWTEKSKKGTLLGKNVPWKEQPQSHEKKRAELEKQLIQEELDEIARPAKELKNEKAELKEKLEKVEKKSKKGTVLGKRVPLLEQLTPEQEEAARVAKLLLKSRLAEVKKEQKALKPAKQSDEWKKKIGDKWGDTAASGLAGGSGVAKIGSAAALGSKEIGHLTGNTGVAGSSTMAGGHQVITQVGTATQGAVVESEVAGLLSLGSDLAKFSSIANAIQEGDEAEQLQAKLDAIDLGYSLGSRLMALGRGATAMAGDFGGAELATTIVADALPGIDIASAALQLIMHGQQLYDAADRLKSQGNHIKQAETEGHTHLAKAIGQFKEENTALAVSSGVNMVADVLKITGAAISLSGVGIMVGHPIKYVGVAVSVLNKGAMATRGAVRTGKAQQAREANILGQKGSEGKLLRHDPKHAIQTLINEARKGEGSAGELALKELKALGIDEKTLAGSSDKSLRKLALGRMGVKEDAKTLGQSLKEGKEGAKAWYHEDTGKQVKVLKEVKNKLNYGGEGERGALWTAKMRLLGGYDPESTASIHKILQSMTPEERGRLGITDEEVDATATRFERDLKKKEKSAKPMAISGPLGVGPFQPPHEPFQPPVPTKISDMPKGISDPVGDRMRARLNALKQPTNPDPVGDRMRARLNALKQPDPVGDQMRARLNALKQPTDPNQVDDQMRSRLNALKQSTDPNSADEQMRARLNALKQHTDPNQIDDQMRARLNALKRPTNPDPVDEQMRARLNALKQTTDPNQVDEQMRARLNALSPNQVVVDPEDPAFDRSAQQRITGLTPNAPNQVVDPEDPAFDRSAQQRINGLTPNTPNRVVVDTKDPAFDRSAQQRLNALAPTANPHQESEDDELANLPSPKGSNTPNQVMADTNDPASESILQDRLDALQHNTDPNQVNEQKWERGAWARLNALEPTANLNQEEEERIWQGRRMGQGRISVEDAL